MLIGADYTVGIPLLSEWAPAKKRAGILGWLLVFWTIGYCISYIVRLFHGRFCRRLWQRRLASRALHFRCAQPDRPVIRFGTPESPCGTSPRGRPQEALANIHTYLGNQYGLPDRGEEKPASTSWFALFAPEQWRNTVVSGVFFFAQVLPFFAISIFLPLVLSPR